MLEELTGTSIETQRKWLKFLIERVGHNNLPKLLNYYMSIGWISESASIRLLEMAGSEKRYKGVSWTLSAEEQRISRFFIEKLKGVKIEDSLLNVPVPGKAKPDIEKKIEIRRQEHIHPVEKKKMEISIHRREVTINNLEQKLEEKYAEIEELKGRIQELENAFEETRKELMKNKIYMDIMDQNIRLKKAVRFGKNIEKSKRSR
ncbi:MAG TPA: FlaD/FlaE family flagellar protein [Candidatus Methanoperedens sp.]|nr:FlaD/FlaE family flagellar protein [Candidatus Methanoperedens sp.]